MPSSIEKIVDRFPFLTINPIIGTPDYESIADIHLKLNLNAVSVQSNLGCGTLGLLFFNRFARCLRHFINHQVCSAS